MQSFQVLDQNEIDAIHQASLDLLHQTGIQIDHPHATQVLQDAGCRVQNGRLCFTPDIVERSLKQCPPQVSLQGRSGKVIHVGDGQLYWHNLGGAHSILDNPNGDLRPASIRDLQDCTRLLDALDGVDEIVPFFTPQDVPPQLINLAMYRHALPYTTKPLAGPGLQTAQEVRYIHEMAAVIGNPSEVVSVSVSPISPLKFPYDLVAAILEAASLNIPFWPLPCPTTGLSAPLSLAGALALQNAEILACIVLAQLTHPGLPITYCGRLSILEPRSAGSSWGNLAMGLASAACVQIGHSYHLPVNVYGLSTDSNQMDIQNGYERSINALLPALAGADELSGIGELSAGTCTTFAQLLCDNDIVLGIKRLRQGFAVDKDTLALELMKRVIPGDGMFIAEHETVRALRSGETYFPKTVNHLKFEEWMQGGRMGMEQNAQSRVDKLLATHEVPPLGEEQERELDAIMLAAECELT
jgi:trimethylamine--corrinoid protein Co-methyltransferase